MSSKKFTLYWSSLDSYEKCPQQFLWSRGWGAIDLGDGPGRRKPVPLKESRHHAVMGIVLAGVIEDLYNLELWKHPVGLRERLEELTKKKFALEVARNHIDWRTAPPRDEMLEICMQGALGYVGKTLKAHKLLGPFAKAEYELVGFVDKYNPVGGRADLIFRRDDTGTTILDGKNSQEHWDRTTNAPMYYTDPDQLRWYALCYYLAFRKMPDRLCFAYFRYPTGYDWKAEAKKYREEAATGPTHAWKTKVAEFYEAREPATGLSWVEFCREDLKGLAARAVDVRKGMDKERFDAKPSPSGCRFCDYESVCPQRQNQKDENKSKRRNFKADPLLDNASGLVQFGFGSNGGSVRRD